MYVTLSNLSWRKAKLMSGGFDNNCCNHMRNHLDEGKKKRPYVRVHSCAYEHVFICVF